MEYLPKVRRPGLSVPFGYFVNPNDHKIVLPDPHKIDCLHYAFRMRAKHTTSIRDCTQWLHAATGQRLTPAGFMYAYKRWLKKLKSENMKQIHAKKNQIIKEQEALYKDLGFKIEDGQDITALAYNAVAQSRTKKEG